MLNLFCDFSPVFHLEDLDSLQIDDVKEFEELLISSFLLVDAEGFKEHIDLLLP